MLWSGRAPCWCAGVLSRNEVVIMSILAVRLLGPFSAVAAEQEVPGLNRHRLQELFAYLLLHTGRRHPREIIADALWGEADSGHARKYLRQGLWQLQSALRTPGLGAQWRLVVDAQSVRFVAGHDFWLDTDVLDASYTRARGIPVQDLDAPTCQALREAVELYRGPLLEDCYRDWCVQDRARLDAEYVAILDKLIVLAELQGDYESGLDYGARILRRDRACEQTHRRMMRLHYLRGDRTAALRQFHACVSALDDEFGVEPTHSTISLNEQIRADERLAVSTGVGAAFTAIAASADSAAAFAG